MGYSNSGKRRKGHRNAHMQQQQLQEIEAAEVTEEEVVEEEQAELQIDEVNGDLLHSPSVFAHETVETKSISSSSSSSPSYYSSLSSSSASFSTTALPMWYSRRRRRATSPRAASKTDNSPRVQQSVKLGAPSLSSARKLAAPSSSSSTSPSPSPSPADASSHSFESCASSSSSSSPPLLPRMKSITSAEKSMLAVAGPSQHVPSYRGRKRHAAIRPTRPTRDSRAIPQQPASQLIPWWKHWESVAVNLANVPLEADTFTIWKAFRKEGDVFSIDLFEDSHGNRESRGKVRFKLVMSSSLRLFFH